MTLSYPPVGPNTHKDMADRVYSRLEVMSEADPATVRLIKDYITSLRFEAARHRVRWRRAEAALKAVRERV